MKILLFGGTTEGRLLALELIKEGYEVLLSVASNMGAEELEPKPDGLKVRIGRLEQPEMEALLADFDLCIDATHPYAVIVTQNIAAACAASETPLRRLLRPASNMGECVLVEDAKAAAQYLETVEGNVMLTTGAKELEAFSSLNKDRLFARVLPTVEGITACEMLGIPHRNIIAMQGPFSEATNEALIDQYEIAYLVTKDGGKRGGFEEKQQAAKNKGIKLILIKRPEDAGVSYEELLDEMKKGFRI